MFVIFLFDFELFDLTFNVHHVSHHLFLFTKLFLGAVVA